MTSDSAGTATDLPDIRPDVEHQAFLDAGEFRVLRARDTGEMFYYPRVAAPRTGSRDLEWVAPSGRGTVYAVTIISQRPPTPYYNVVLVDLEEGPRVMSRVEGIPNDEIVIGMAVQARVDQVDGHGILVFVPADQETAA